MLHVQFGFVLVRGCVEDGDQRACKCRLRHNCTKLELRVLRDDKMIKLLVIPFDDLGWHQLSVQIIVGYKFILRVLSARLKITMGAADQTLQTSYGVATAYGSKVVKNAVSGDTESDDGEMSEVRRVHEQSKRESDVGERNGGFLT